MSMGYEEGDPRREIFEENWRNKAWQLKPGQRPNTNGYGPQPNGRPDPGPRRFT